MTLPCNGHGTDPTGPVRQSFGAIAAVATSSDAPGGVVDVRSIAGNIFGNNRAFDVSGRNRLVVSGVPKNYAYPPSAGKQNITLTRTGGFSNFNPVVDASSPTVGDKGGKNELRSFSGNIIIGTSALVSAAVPAGTGSVQGINLLTSCLGVIGTGTVTPAATISGGCVPAAPAALYLTCASVPVKIGDRDPDSSGNGVGF